VQIDNRIEVPLSRHVFVHFHVFKNGGSTIEAILEREFRGRFATLHGWHADSVLDEGDIATFLGAHPGIAALSSHHLRYPLPAMRRTVLFDCCFLRHPLDRLQSVYTYLRGRASESEDALFVLARNAGPREFMTTLIEEFPHVAGNAQTLLLANAGAFTRPMDETDLDRAIGTLRQMALPGMVEMFDESLVTAEHFLAPAFPNLRLHYVVRNVTRPPHYKMEQRLEELRMLWSASVYQEMIRLNRLDLELCAFAESEVRRRFSLVPDSSARLMEFRDRCLGLRLQVAS
jgi:hypothetical protein